MRVELLKVRTLPTPRYLFLASFLLVLLGAAIVYAVDPADSSWYRDAPFGVAQVAVLTAAIVLGAWMAGIEFAHGTIRRTITTEPRRSVVLAEKVLVTLLVTAAGSAAIAIAALSLGALAAELRDAGFETGEAAREALAIAVSAALIAPFALAITLLARSLTAGLIASFVILFVIDGILGIVPGVGDLTFGSAQGSISSAIEGEARSDLSLAAALAVAFAWIAVALSAGGIRFLRGDFK